METIDSEVQNKAKDSKKTTLHNKIEKFFIKSLENIALRQRASCNSINMQSYDLNKI